MTPVYRLRWPAIMFSLLLALFFSHPLTSRAAEEKQRDMTVMTQNLYFGSDEAPVLNATTPDEFISGVATIYATVQFTNFPVRAEAIAEEISAKHPDIIGLQEAYTITTTDIPAGTTQTLDYLNILLGKLSDLGLSYSVASIKTEYHLEDLPLIQPCSKKKVGNCWVSVADRDVILVNNKAPLQVLDTQSGTYDKRLVYKTILKDVLVDRGWTYIDGTFEGKKFRFVNTHLEEEYFPDIQEAQAAEFLAGPAKTEGTVIAVGDFNSAADGSNTKSYALLTKSYFKDAWSTNPGVDGFTCCQNVTLTNEDSLLHERVDYVLTHPGLQAVNATNIGDTPISSTPPLWSSDHAGVIATVHIP